jgi:acetylornithine deacetylase/succinyl-diaminopimelate desuccinylase-like protein
MPKPLLEKVNWPLVLDESLELFRTLLRFDTTNPPGDEIEAARWLEELFRSEGIDVQVLESAPGRGNVVARLHGDGTGGDPILLSAHLDVVPADADRWTHPPFAAEIHDGFLWGRGTIDMKNMAAMEVTTMLLLHRLGADLKRDVIFAGVADEEAGCEFGSLYLARNHPELIRGEYAISEIGGFTQHVGGVRFYPVQVAEKGMCWMTIRAEGTSGHGSLPASDNPIAKIARAAELLDAVRLPHHRTSVVDRFIRTLADHQPFPNSVILRSLLSPSLSDLVLDKIFPEESLVATFDAALHNTATPTILRGGTKVNQVPNVAELQVDGRLLPGQTGEDLVREIRAVIGVEYDIRIDRELPAVVGDAEDPIAGLIKDILERHDPGAIVVPTMIPGFTDAKAYDELGMKCWGFSPVKLPEGLRFAEMFHGVDERIPVEGYKFGVKALFELVTELVL